MHFDEPEGDLRFEPYEAALLENAGVYRRVQQMAWPLTEGSRLLEAIYTYRDELVGLVQDSSYPPTEASEKLGVRRKKDIGILDTMADNLTDVLAPRMVEEAEFYLKAVS